MKESYTVRHGGLMRCCLLVLDDAMVAADAAPREGDKVICRYCKSTMVYREGAWRWDDSAPRGEAAAP